MAKTPEEMAQSMIDNMPEKTGNSLDRWLIIVSASGLNKHGAIVNWLKKEHGVTHGFANLIAHKQLIALKPKTEEPVDLVGNQYSGGKAGLYPIYEQLIKQIEKFGDDVMVSPKKTYVSLRRNKQFALIQPSTRTRVDIGLNLNDVAETKRLELSGKFNQMVSHRVRVSSVEEVDEALVSWLREAYDGG